MTANRVLKWTVEVDDRQHEIGGGKVVHVASQYADHDTVHVWTVEDGSAAPRVVQAFGTGQPLPPTAGEHLGSVVVLGGALVWHLFALEQLCPECAQGKPQNCVGQALEPVTDDLVPCSTNRGRS